MNILGNTTVHKRYVSNSVVTNIYLAYLFLFNLFYMDGSYYDLTFGRYKFYTFLAVSGVYVLVSVIVSAVYRRPVVSELTPMDYVLLLYLILCILSSCTSVYFPETIIGFFRFEGVLSVAVFVLVFICVKHTYVFRDRHIYLVALVCSLECGLTVLQLMGLNPGYLYGDSNFYGDGMVTNQGKSFAGTVGNTNTMAGWLCIFIVLFLIYLIRTKWHKGSLLVLVSLLLCIIVIFGIGVTIGILSCLVAVALVMPAVLISDNKRRIYVYLLLFVVSIVILIVVYFNDFGIPLVSTLKRILHGDLRPSDAHGRVKIWGDVVSEVRGSNLLLGHGADTVGYFGIGRFHRVDEATGAVFWGTAVDAHSMYLGILFDFGLPALILFIIFIFGTVVSLIFAKCSSVSIAIACGLLAYLIAELFLIVTPCVDIYFFALAGVAYAVKEVEV